MTACESDCRLRTDPISRRWRWLVISDAALRDKVAALYRDAYLQRVGGQLIADLLPADTPGGRLMSSTEWLVENLAKVPLLVIPCYEPYIPRMDGDESFFAATLYGSIFPAVWNFQLALHSRGYGTCITTLHLAPRRRGARLLEIPDTYTQGCLLPVCPNTGRPNVPSGDSAVDRGSGRPEHVGRTIAVNPKLQELCDRAEILDCMHRYARGMDRLDRTLLRSAYHDGAIDDHASDPSVP